MRERNELRQGLRGDIIISGRVLLSGPLEIHAEIKDCPDTGRARSYFAVNLATETEGTAINDDVRAEKERQNSLSESHIIDLMGDQSIVSRYYIIIPIRVPLSFAN
jgi:hypothetical protein